MEQAESFYFTFMVDEGALKAKLLCLKLLFAVRATARVNAVCTRVLLPHIIYHLSHFLKNLNNTRSIIVPLQGKCSLCLLV